LLEIAMRNQEATLSSPLVLHLGQALLRLSDEEFYRFCQLHRDLRFERTRNGDLIVMPPTGGETGRRNTSLTAQLANWSEVDGTGIAFDSSTGFRLPLGGERSPDVSWVRLERWEALTPEQRDQFPPLAPDFVVELRSKTDSLDELRAKMAEYIDNGVRLGWLLDPSTQTAWIYTGDGGVTKVDAPETLSGDPVLPGFTLQLVKIWQ
jgi:Uma2 family endonuclease